MKTIRNFFFGLLAAGGALIALSCDRQDYPDRFTATQGVPTVHFVRYANMDENIDQAYMDEIVCIVGDNLRSVSEVWFNDKKSVLNTSYMTDHTILVSTPKEQASVQTDMIYLVTASNQTVTYPFKVLPPAPVITGMSCEYAPQGSEVKINGSYFIDLEYVEFQGANARVNAADLKYTSSEITLTIPKTATAGQIKVKTNSGLSGSPFHYLDSRGMLFTFEDGALQVKGWNPATIVSNPDDGISGNYIQFGDGDAHGLSGDGGTWSEGAGGYSMPYWPGSWNTPEDYSECPRLTDFADFSNFANMAIKFEMKISPDTPWKSNAMQIIPAPVTAVTLGKAVEDIDGNQVAGANNTYYHDNLDLPRGYYTPWAATGSFDTGDQWITVTVPISEFTYGWEGEKASGELNANSFTSLLIFFHGGKGADCKPIIKVDNIRAVSIK